MVKYIPLFIITAIILAMDLYCFQAIRVTMHSSSFLWKRIVYTAYWSVTAITLAAIYYGVFFDFFSLPQIFRVYLFGILIIFLVPKLIMMFFLLIDDVFRGGKWLFGKISSSSNKPSISRAKFLSQLGLIIGGFMFFQFVYGMIRTAFNYNVRRVKIPLANLPDEFDGWKIVQVSDIHSGSFVSTEPIVKAIELVNRENADVIFFTGDLVNNMSKEADPFIQVLQTMKARLGVYSIFGNHDYGDYMRWDANDVQNEIKRKADVENLAAIHQRIGWKLLRNQNILLGEEGKQLAIIGMENWGTHFTKYGDMKKSYAGAEHAQVKILLSHDPSHWDAEVSKQYTDVDVTLSGHTHGFQFGVEIPGLRWSPSQYMYPHWAGLYQQANQYLYVNRGIGFLAYPGRVGIRPEITVIELVKA